jgi:hypothetical protein
MVLTINVAFNEAFMWGFGSDNPGLLYEVTLHELGHGLQIEDAFNSVTNGTLDLPYTSDQQNLENILSTRIFQTNNIMNGNSNLEPDATQRGMIYAPAGFQPSYNWFNIKW